MNLNVTIANLKKATNKCLIFISGTDYVQFEFRHTIKQIKERNPGMLTQTIQNALIKHPGFTLLNTNA